jgi:hypothetical protein
MEVGMKKQNKGMRILGVIVILCLLLSVVSGCATKGQTGALTGAGAGALIGGLANSGGSWGATALIGAGVGAGIGYLIGNEQDKKDAENRQKVTEAELKPFAGTTWQVISINPKPEKVYKSIVAKFKRDGTVVTTKTNMEGDIETVTEKYRVIGSTLILNKPDYVQNMQFKIEGKKLILDFGNRSAVLQKIS